MVVFAAIALVAPDTYVRLYVIGVLGVAGATIAALEVARRTQRAVATV